MMLVEQVFSQAMVLAGEVEQNRANLLRLFCQSAAAGLQQRLREGFTPEDCKADFVAAGALYALAALAETDLAAGMQRVQFGDVTLVSGGISEASRCLRYQANLIIGPYCKDNLVFRGI